MPIISTIRGNLRATSGFRKKLGVGSTGGSVTTVGSYRVHTFQTGSRSGQDFTFVSDGFGTIELLLVGGGGGGGGDVGGGGGGGGVLSTSLQVSPGSYTVRVGEGGLQGSSPFNGAGFAGGQSSLILNGSALATVLGGGGGRGRSGGDTGDGSRLNGFNTGGGGYDSVTGTAFEPTGGFRGANRLDVGNVLCGGGGGSGQAGQQGSGNTGGAGGGGASNSISGSTVVYGGGGGGSMYSGGFGGAGGNGGGGKGADHSSNNAGSGTNGLGGGGGGARSTGNVEAGNGGSGIVILRYIP